MENDIEQYKVKISGYSSEQLEEILISLNRDKFPEKYKVVREMLAAKMNAHSSVSEGMGGPLPEVNDEEKTEVAPPTQSIIPPPLMEKAEKPKETATMETPSLAMEEAKALSEGPEPAASLKSAKPLVIEPPKEKIRSGADIQKPKIKNVREMVQEEEEEEKPKERGAGFFFWFLSLLVLLTSGIALYVLLCTAFNLPGKTAIVEIGKKIPAIPAASEIQTAKVEPSAQGDKSPAQDVKPSK